MLVPICEECYKKIVAKKALPLFPCQGPDMPIKEYLKLFQMYLVTLGESIDTEKRNRLFVHGLSNENRNEIGMLPFISARLKADEGFIENTVLYLSSVEDYKNVIFGKRDDKKDN